MDVETFAATKLWFSSLERQWEEPVSNGERTSKSAILVRFCAAGGRNPDELISDCLITGDDGAQKISVKKRRQVWDSIMEFGKENGLGDANVIRSFFIHNGIMMQSPVGR